MTAGAAGVAVEAGGAAHAAHPVAAGERRHGGGVGYRRRIGHPKRRAITGVGHGGIAGLLARELLPGLRGLLARPAVRLKAVERTHLGRHIPPGFVFHDQVGGVGGDDAVLARQFGDFVAQLRVLAVQPDFVQQVADPPGGPEPRDESCFRRFLGEFDLVGELLRARR